MMRERCPCGAEFEVDVSKQFISVGTFDLRSAEREELDSWRKEHPCSRRSRYDPTKDWKLTVN